MALLRQVSETALLLLFLSGYRYHLPAPEDEVRGQGNRRDREAGRQDRDFVVPGRPGDDRAGVAGRKRRLLVDRQQEGLGDTLAGQGFVKVGVTGCD
jgi:hypothetical protein